MSTIKKKTAKTETHTIHEIIDIFEGIGGGSESFSREHGIILFRALSFLPKEIAEWAIEKLVFVSSMDDYSAYTVNIEELERRGKVWFVVLCENLKNITAEGQALTIAHEIAHCRLGHPTTFDDEGTRTAREVTDEEEADKLARSWLSGTRASSGQE